MAPPGRSSLHPAFRNGSPSAMCCPQTHSVGSSAKFVTDSLTFNAAEPWSIVSVFSIQYGVR